jgi:hypothetical protein
MCRTNNRTGERGKERWKGGRGWGKGEGGRGRRAEIYNGKVMTATR